MFNNSEAEMVWPKEIQLNCSTHLRPAPFFRCFLLHYKNSHSCGTIHHLTSGLHCQSIVNTPKSWEHHSMGSFWWIFYPPNSTLFIWISLTKIQSFQVSPCSLTPFLGVLQQLLSEAEIIIKQSHCCLLHDILQLPNITKPHPSFSIHAGFP